MKTKLTLILILLFGLNLKLRAQKIISVEDSLKKYDEIFTLLSLSYKNLPSDTLHHYYLKWVYWHDLKQDIKDSIYRENNKAILEKKYKIKFKSQ